MMFRSIALATTMSLLSVAVSTTAHAGENAAAERDVAAAPATPPGAVLTRAPVERAEPEAGTGRVVGEVLAGVGVGVGVAVGTGALAYVSFGPPTDGWDDLGNTAAAFLIGGAMYPLGAGLGVGLVGNAGDVHGSYAAAIGGAYLGSLAGMLLGAGLIGGENRGAATFIGYVAGAPIGAAIAHTMTLKHDEPATGLVNVSGNRTRLSIPAVSVTPDPLRPQGTVMSLRLMDGRF